MLEKGSKVIVTHGRLKGETGIFESSRVSANYETMYWIKRDKENARHRFVQVESRWIKLQAIGDE